MKRIMRNRKGFTLAELLIVVAIIAVLVAVSIPIFTSRLERAREATDVANFRAAYAAGVAEYLGNTDAYDGKTNATTKYYDASSGQLADSAPTGYLKGTGTDGGGSTTVGGYAYAGGTSYANKVITVSIADGGTVTLGVQ